MVPNVLTTRTAARWDWHQPLLTLGGTIHEFSIYPAVDPDADLPVEPMEVAQEFVNAKRERKLLRQRDEALKTYEAKLNIAVRELVLAGKLPTSFAIDGANVHQKHEVWASVPDDKVAEFRAIAEREDMTYMISGKPNTQSLSAYVREHMSDDVTKDAAERAREGGLPEDLIAVLNITDKHYTNANGL